MHRYAAPSADAPHDADHRFSTQGSAVVGDEPMVGEGFGPGWDVAADDRVAHRSVGPVPLDDPLEEHSEHAQPLPLGVGSHGGASSDAGLDNEPELEVLDAGAVDLGDGPDVGVLD